MKSDSVAKLHDITNYELDDQSLFVNKLDKSFNKEEIESPDLIDLDKQTNKYLLTRNTSDFVLNDSSQSQIGWWIGRIEEVHDDYFNASMQDAKGHHSIVEFDINEVTPSEQHLLTPDARFSYRILQVDKFSGREYVSKLSISGPAIWTEYDDQKAKELYQDLFPEELFDI